MAPGSRKRSVSSPRRSDPRSERGGGGPSKKQAKGTTKNVITKPLSNHGFSKKKRPKYQPGTKILLDDTIYDDKVPADVKGHYFLYEVSEIHDGGKTVKVQYKDQVIKKSGDHFRVYKEGDDPQVRCCLSFHLFGFCFSITNDFPSL